MIFSREFYEENKDKIEDGFLKVIEKDNLLCWIYDDARCPFLDRKTRLCKIYEKRPQICSDYGYIEKLQCPYFKKSGNRRSKASEKKIMRMIDKQVEEFNKRNGSDF
jgi:Fe-S-cluster containining protein